jgi:mutator protein MutT
MQIRVVAGILEQAGRVLCAQRGRGQDRAGLWEFPGGKVEPGEDDETALVRELAEELGIAVSVHEHIATSVHTDARRTIELIGYRCTVLHGTPEAREHADLRWLQPAELGTLTWAPADLPLVAALIPTETSR